MPDRTGLTDRTLIVVLGMHRGGARVIAHAVRAFDAVASAAEKQLAGATGGMPGDLGVGALEAFNDELLSDLGGAWDAAQLLPVATLDGKRHAVFAKRAQALLVEAFGSSPRLVLADPRLCRLLDFWIPQFEAAGLRTRYVLVLRDPRECARSMQERDGVPLSLGRWLWADHMTSAGNQTAGRERIFLSWEALLDDPLESLRRLAEFVGVDPADDRMTAVAQSVVTSQVRRQPRDGAIERSSCGGQGDMEVDAQLFEALTALALPGMEESDETLAPWYAARAAIMRLRSGIAHDARDELPIMAQPMSPIKTAAVLHVYYSEQWPELAGLLERLAPDIDLFVSVASDRARPLRHWIECFDPRARVLVLANRGRDISPFLQILPRLIEAGYDCACKLHTKRSDYVDVDGLGWRNDLWGGLLGRSEMVEHVRLRFACDDRLGMLGPQRHWLSLQDYRESRQESVLALAARLLGGPAPQDWHFFAGTMFWFRPEALQRLLDLGLTPDDFEPEQGQREGTLAHVVERALPIAVRASGYWIDTYPHSGAMRAHVGDTLPAFTKTSVQHLLGELEKTREQLSFTEGGLQDAQRLALQRQAKIEELDMALSQAQKLAWEREAALAQIRRSLAGRIAIALQRFKS